MSDFGDYIKAIGDNDLNQGPKHWLSTGFVPLDHAISGKYVGGGLPGGRIIEIFGPPSAGKTAISTNVMINAQRAGGIAMFFDHERSFDSRLAERMGLDLTPGRWIFRTPKTFEESIANAMNFATKARQLKLISKEAPIVIVFDSLAAMVPQSKMEKEVTALNMNDNTALARATAAVFPALAQRAEEDNITIIFLNQMRTKIGVMFGDPTTTPGGNAPEFYASVRIKLGRSQLTQGTGDAKVRIGQRIGAECVKNKVSRPFRKVEWDFLFSEDGTGYFDVVGSTIDYLVGKGILKSDRGRVTWIDGKSPYRKELIEKITSEGLMSELLALMPADRDETVDEDA